MLAAAGAYTIVGLSAELAILLGAVLVVTGPTVIGPLLRQLQVVDASASLRTSTRPARSLRRGSFTVKAPSWATMSRAS